LIRSPRSLLFFRSLPPRLPGHRRSDAGNAVLPTPSPSCGHAAPPTPRSADPIEQGFSCQPTWLSYAWNAVPGCLPGCCPSPPEQIKVYRQKGARRRAGTAGTQSPAKPGEAPLSPGLVAQRDMEIASGQRNPTQESKSTPRTSSNLFFHCSPFFPRSDDFLPSPGTRSLTTLTVSRGGNTPYSFTWPI